MSRLKVSLLATVLCLPVAWTAHAGGLADPVVEPVPTAPIVAARMRGNWEGPYVGAELGYGRAKFSPFDGTGTGAIGGVFFGYNAQFGGTVLGGELGISAARLKFDSGERVRSIARAKVRLGADAGDFMPYVAAGWSRGSGTGGNGNGPFAGVGIDYALTPTTVLGAELLHHRWRDYANTDERMSTTTAAVRISYRF